MVATRNLLILFTLTMMLLSEAAHGRAACQPFRVHLSSPLPPAPALAKSSVPEGDWEERLVDEIARIPSQDAFRDIYQTWVKGHGRHKKDIQRYNWLRCVLHYVKIDTDKDGVVDWSAIIDGQPSEVLFPEDDDIDGDGVANVLDPNPFDKDVTGDTASGEIPAHVKLKGASAELQQLLYSKYGILVLNHTDEHSTAVLKELVFLLKHGFPENMPRTLGNLRYFYAFSGHDSRNNIAAYHHKAKSISLGGRSTYPEQKLDPESRVRVLAALAHEIGHAYLFSQISPEELRLISERFGNWQTVFNNEALLNLYAPPFFRAHSLSTGARSEFLKTESLSQFVKEERWRRSNLTSRYATTNIHEWFADAFAGSVLQRIGEAGHFGKGWRDRLIYGINRSGGHWVNYNNLSSSFREWVDAKLQQSVLATKTNLSVSTDSSQEP